MSKRLLRMVAGNTGRLVKVYYDSEVKEYVCRLYVKDKLYEPADYFTDDKQDAFQTAESMSDQPNKNPAKKRTAAQAAYAKQVVALLRSKASPYKYEVFINGEHSKYFGSIVAARTYAKRHKGVVTALAPRKNPVMKKSTALRQAKTAALPYILETSLNKKTWKILGAVISFDAGKQIANDYSSANSCYVRMKRRDI